MTSTPYEADFYLWTQQQAALLRAGALTALDIEHLIEEILGKSHPQAQPAIHTPAGTARNKLARQYQQRAHRAGGFAQRKPKPERATSRGAS